MSPPLNPLLLLTLLASSSTAFFLAPPPSSFLGTRLRSAAPAFPEDLPPSSSPGRRVKLEVPLNLEVSTTVREGVTSLYGEEGEAGAAAEGGESNGYDEQQQSISQAPAAQQQQQQMREIDPRGVMLKVVAPAIASSALLTTSTYFLLTSLRTRRLNTIATYASEMVYHSNSQTEMMLCHQATSKRILRKKGEMRQAYVELFVKKKAVSVKAVESFSYALTLFKLTESKAADLLCSVAKGMRKAPASRGKLLFFGERILKSPEGLAGLQPIRDMLASSYRTGGAEIVSIAQKTMGET
eukprot:CAMPEP_0182458268 /NCGR_PEP_ID=MMETSP1319-20130603/3651_1 /TAXON_ID=172717 /ORGANISM="Bolidomonas pacifica, Strain RCC208" /LENGTH=296 /DNA_ID=CAMNT_0024656923 /DNA_START=117 /DNA_END=1003 /DNA_ORIENTATION=-